MSEQSNMFSLFVLDHTSVSISSSQLLYCHNYSFSYLLPVLNSESLKGRDHVLVICVLLYLLRGLGIWWVPVNFIYPPNTIPETWSMPNKKLMKCLLNKFLTDIVVNISSLAPPLLSSTTGVSWDTNAPAAAAASTRNSLLLPPL